MESENASNHNDQGVYMVEMWWKTQSWTLLKQKMYGAVHVNHNWMKLSQ